MKELGRDPIGASRSRLWPLVLGLVGALGLAAFNAAGQEDPKQAELDLARKLNAEGVSAHRNGRYVEAEQLLKRALAIREALLGPEHPHVAQSLINLASACYSRGRYGEAERFLRRALAIDEKVLGPDHPDVAMGLNNLAEVNKSRGKYGEAEPLLKRALAIREKVLQPDHPDVAQSLNGLAGLYSSQGKHADAEPLFKRALAIWEKALGPENPHVAKGLSNLAALYDSLGKHGEAERFLKRALAIREKVLQPDHPDVAQSLNGLACHYRWQGKDGEAESPYRRALAICERALGPEHPNVATGLANLAGLYEWQGKHSEAEALYKRALVIREKVLGPEHSHVAASLTNLAGLYKSQGKYGEPELLLKRALAICEKVLGPDHPDVAERLNNLAALYDWQGKDGEAEPLLKRALAIREKVLGPDHPGVAMSLNNLATNCKELGDLAAAWEYAQRARRVLLHVRGAAAESPVTKASFLGKHLRQHFVPCLALALGKKVDVLELAEQERALALRDLLAEARAQATSGLSHEEQQNVAAARGRINALNRQIEKLAANRLDTAPVRQELLRAEMDYDAVMAELRKRHEQFVAAETASAVTSEQLAKSEVLRDATAIVGWVEFREWAWGFVARQEGVRWEDLSKLSKPDELRAAIRRAAKGLFGGTPAQELAADLAEVRRCRFAPLERHLNGIKRLIVIAQGWAGVLPAEALLAAAPTKEHADPASWAWLADRYEISYAPSATTLDILCRQRSTKKDPKWEKLIAAVADPPFNEEQLVQMEVEKHWPAWRASAGLVPPVDGAPGAMLAGGAKAAGGGSAMALSRAIRFDRGAVPPRLPGTRREAEVLAKLFGAEKSLLLVGPDASERKLFEASAKGELAKCKYVHLATHGLADGERPELSALVLARAPADPDYDGMLQMREVFHLKLNADLVVLSACQSGLGKELRGEGIVGLSTAFFFAGTPSLVLSLWNVPDVSTPLLMRRFYENLEKGQRKSAALREAKHWLRNLTRRDLAELGQKEPSLADLTRALGDKAVESPKGEPADDKPFAHPYYWAPFVLTGDPR